ncbi:hypothetical protein CYMTET_8048 [Cymbomonas tetramitiformis]|uniref:Uncharacterized protein n=1 Tax=Cymbomonas tetramitiformis TaxID=36881 RepID=A0AAE0LGG8_9CHLO|nr:hypothetical protein CYMTET_8048 [Cymbomonas tetramitiformis]
MLPPHRISALWVISLSSLYCECLLDDAGHALYCRVASAPSDAKRVVLPQIHAVLRGRETMIASYREYSIPSDWLKDAGMLGVAKRSPLGLALQYMMRVEDEVCTRWPVLNGVDDDDEEATGTDPQREFLILSGVRFAFRVHQFTGGFDAQCSAAFEQLRNLAVF